LINKNIINPKNVNNKKEGDLKNVNINLMQALGQLDRPMYTGRLRSDCRLIKEYTAQEKGKFLLS